MCCFAALTNYSQNLTATCRSQSCCPADIKNDVESTKYRSISYLQNLGMSDSASKRVGSVYVSFCHLPTFFFGELEGNLILSMNLAVALTSTSWQHA